MTITYSIDHTPDTSESMNAEIAPKSEMTLVSTDVDPKTGEVTSTYVLASGDNGYPATVVYRTSIQKRATGAIRRMSMTFSTWATASNSVDGVDTKKPISASVNINVPADMTIEVTDLSTMVGNAFSFLYPSIAAGVRNNSWLQKLLYGVPQVS